MTTDEKLIEMEHEMVKMNDKLDEVLGCLKGNDMGTVGIVKEVILLKKEVEDIKEQRTTEKAKSDIYMGIIKWLAAVIAALIIAYMFNLAYSRPAQIIKTGSTLNLKKQLYGNEREFFYVNGNGGRQGIT